PKRKHTVEAVVDRLRLRPDAQQRLAESFETALRLSGGLARLTFLDEPQRESEPRKRRAPGQGRQDLQDGRPSQSSQAGQGGQAGALAAQDEQRELVFSSRHACPICGYSVPPLEPKLFSFN